MGDQLILFARYPESGKVKTRLIPVLGERGAVVPQANYQRLVLEFWRDRE